MSVTRASRLAVWVLALSIPAVAAAYERSKVPGGSACLWWGTREVPFLVHRDGSDDVHDESDLSAVRAGYQAWSATDCSDLALRFGGLTTRTDVGYEEISTNNTNLVVWRELDCEEAVPPGDRCWRCLDDGGACCGSLYGCWEHPRGAIAVTTTTFSRITGQLVDADIELNGVDFWFTTVAGPACADPVSPRACAGPADCAADERCFEGRCLDAGCARTDIANTITHEVGHVVGLDHSPFRDSTMYASAPSGEVTKRTLEEDDIQGVCDIYPEGGPTLTCFGDTVAIEPIGYDDQTRGCGGCAGAGGASGLLALLLVAAALVRRRPWASTGRLLLLSAILPVLVPARLAALELDRWLADGEAVVVLTQGSAPRPCALRGFPAIQRVRILEVLAGSLEPGDHDVLVVGAADGRPREASLEVLDLSGEAWGSACSTVPRWTLRPGSTSFAADPEGWRRYVAAVRALAGLPAAEEARQRLWCGALVSPAAPLREYGAARLAEAAALGPLPAPVLGCLGHVIEDGDAPPAGRRAALEIGAAGLPPERLVPVLAEPDLCLQAARALLERSRRQPGSLSSVLEAIRSRHATLVDAPGGTRSALAALLALEGDRSTARELAAALTADDAEVRLHGVVGLEALAVAGDARAAARLRARRELEPHLDVAAQLQRALARPELARTDPAHIAAEQAAERRTGLRMLLVLGGLLALLGMVLLPVAGNRRDH